MSSQYEICYGLLEYSETNLIFVRISNDEMVSLLGRMSLNTKLTAEKSLEVEIPPTRHDILHACDIIEDVAIAVGYNNIPKTLPDACTVANQVRSVYGKSLVVLKLIINNMISFRSSP